MSTSWVLLLPPPLHHRVQRTGSRHLNRIDANEILTYNRILIVHIFIALLSPRQPSAKNHDHSQQMRRSQREAHRQKKEKKKGRLTKVNSSRALIGILSYQLGSTIRLPLTRSYHLLTGTGQLTPSDFRFRKNSKLHAISVCIRSSEAFK